MFSVLRFQLFLFFFFSFFFFLILTNAYGTINGTLTVQIRQMNSTYPMNSNFFIVFSFQQNKLYPNGLIIVNWMMVCLTTINLNNLLAYVQPLLTFPLDGYFCSKLKHSIFTKHSSIKKEILTTNFLNQTYANLHFVLSSLCFCLRYLL